MKSNLKAILAPSILSADFSNLMGDIIEVEREGINWLHVDVMDGHFVPNMTMGSVVVSALRKKTKSILDCHLMVNEPEKFIPWFAKAGADYITVHAEATQDLRALIALIRSSGCKVGVSIKPATSVQVLVPFLAEIDLVLIMSVNPGFGGQSFMPENLKKIETLSKLKQEKGFNFLIEIDGGINADTAKLAREAGTEVFVAGAAIFGEKDRKKAITILNEALK